MKTVLCGDGGTPPLDPLYISGGSEMPIEPIISTVEVSEADVKAVKDEMTAQAAQGAVAGTPIDRIPYNAQLALLEASGVYTKRIANTDRCIRTVEVPQHGGSTIKYHCSRPCVGVGDQRLCPDHNKDFFQPNQTPHGSRPRTLNSDSIPLTKGETDELAKIQKALPRSAPAPVQVATEPVAASYTPGPHEVVIGFKLDELAGKDALRLFVERASEALDGLPCNSVRQMKQIVAIQEKIAKLAKRGKHDAAANTL